MTNKEKKIIISYLKHTYPIGVEIYDDVHGNNYFTVRKDSIFQIYEWDYSDEFKPMDDKDIRVDCYVKKPGKYSVMFFIKNSCKGWLIEQGLNVEQIEQEKKDPFNCEKFKREFLRFKKELKFEIDHIKSQIEELPNLENIFNDMSFEEWINIQKLDKMTFEEWLKKS